MNNGSYTDLQRHVGTGTVTTRSTPGPERGGQHVDDLLSVGETSEVTFSFSEKVTALTKAASPSGRPVPISRAPDGGQTWTVPSPRPRANRLRQRDREQRQLHRSQRQRGTGNSDDTAIDTQAPSVEVNIVDDLLSVGETSEVTFTSCEKVTGFDEGSLNP
ncbi:Ig-like domain-containing protein [Aeromonas veronii]|uniref:Ig-like domain-containing protein n=1 Tax=Aeromonas veronii TaxID=654 RepID=UPI0020004038|nr:Ig-like domain-containing protein [Aeromonas veronii]UPK54835.1 Ig-like domain-containing protein [Aeromonas veronii]